MYWPRGVGTHHYVCVPCRWSVKRPGLCPHCRSVLFDVGHRFRTPKKRDDAGWKWVAERVEIIKGYIAANRKKYGIDA